MKNTKQHYYNKVAEVLEFVYKNNIQTNTEQTAKNIGVKASYIQEIFSKWVGISPEKYLQYLNINYIKELLKKSNLDIKKHNKINATIEIMTPHEYKNKGKNLNINYCFSDSYFGEILIASTKKGICYISFVDNRNDAIFFLKQIFPNAQFSYKYDDFQQMATTFFNNDKDKQTKIPLHLKGSEFQIKVWQTLLKIPMGHLSTYSKVAQSINNPKATRAVGSAIGSNLVSYIIPCHRVILTSGNIGNYLWNPIRKKAIIGWEIAKTHCIA